MRVNDAYQIQKKYYGKWEYVGEFENLEAAKTMLRDLKNRAIHG